MANILAEAAPTAAENAAAKVEDAESMPYKTASERFHRLFTVGADEKLVSYYSCCLLGGGLPAQVQIQCCCSLICDTMIVISIYIKRESLFVCLLVTSRPIAQLSVGRFG